MAVTVGLFYLLVPDLDTNNWKYIFLIYGIISIIGFSLSIVYLVEGPLNLLQRGFSSEGIEAMKHIIY